MCPEGPYYAGKLNQVFYSSLKKDSVKFLYTRGNDLPSETILHEGRPKLLIKTGDILMQKHYNLGDLKKKTVQGQCIMLLKYENGQINKTIPL